MLAETQTLNKILSRARELSPESRLLLVQRIIQTLVPASPPEQSRPLRFGEFGGDEASMSSLEDFAIAEWHPTDEELDGP